MVKEKLNYESHEPAFLRRLKGHYDTVEERPPQDVSRIRKSQRNDDVDDELTILDENGEAVTKEAFSARQTAANVGAELMPASSANESQTVEVSRKTTKASVKLAPTAKRKVARVIGNEAREDAPGQSQLADKETPRGNKPEAKKKAKRPKLSFEDN